MISPLPSNYLQNSFRKSTKQAFFVGGKYTDGAFEKAKPPKDTGNASLYRQCVTVTLLFSDLSSQ